MSNARKTPRQLTALLRTYRVGDPGYQPEFTVVTADRKLRFKGSVKIGAVVYDCANSNGKIATFGDVDSFVKYAASCVETIDGTYTVEIITGAVLVKTLPADMQAWAADEVVRLGVKRAAQQAVVGELDVQLGLMVGWDINGNALQQAKFAEVTEQKAAVLGDIAAIDAEIIRLTP